MSSLHPQRRQPSRLGSVILKQIGIFAFTGAVVAFLAPCSPVAVWGTGYCPTNLWANKPAATAPVATATHIDFNASVIAASHQGPVLVDFHADWCGPCRTLAPRLDAVVSGRPGLSLVKIDTDAQPELARAHGVRSIPDVRLWHGGREVAAFVGVRSESDIRRWIESTVPATP